MFRPLLLVTAAAVGLAACGATPQPASNRHAALTVQAISPAGAVDWPFTFSWTGNVPAGAVCRVSVFDVAERQLLQRDTKDRKIEAPEDLRLLLPSARRFLWRVSVLDENGAEVAQSPLTEFTVR